MSQVSTKVFSRHIAIIMLLLIGTSFASAHIAARVSFDQGTGLLTAVVFRSGVSLLLLGSLIFWHKKNLRIGWRLTPWQLALGLLLTVQSISIYTAVSHIPIGIALLIVNTFPAQLALVTWALGGNPPTKKASILMGIIFIGLLLALDIPNLIQSDVDDFRHWVIGISFSFLAAFVFSIGLWVTENKLMKIEGSTRSFYALLTILIVSFIAGQSDIIPGGFSLPENNLGWLMLLLLSAFYAAAFITLFTLAPRLNLAQNAPAMNIEPVASLSLGWVILGQHLSTIQIIGGAVVVSCIIALSHAKK